MKCQEIQNTKRQKPKEKREREGGGMDTLDQLVRKTHSDKKMKSLAEKTPSHINN